LVAVGAPVPLRALLVAYALSQAAASVPVFPVALGVAEGSLALALACAGVHPAAALETAVVYRLITHWLQLPLGWALWACVRRREHSTPPQAEYRVSWAPEGGEGVECPVDTTTATMTAPGRGVSVDSGHGRSSSRLAFLPCSTSSSHLEPAAAGRDVVGLLVSTPSPTTTPRHPWMHPVVRRAARRS